MAYEMRPNSGSLFKNNEKRPDKKDPDVKGKIMLPDGSTHWISGWTKQTTAGEKWISLQIGNPVQGAAKPVSDHSAAKANAFVSEPDDDIPF